MQRGNYFAETSVRARAMIAEVGARFIRPGSMLLVHGHSRVVLALLRKAVAQVSPTQVVDQKFLSWGDHIQAVTLSGASCSIREPLLLG